MLLNCTKYGLSAVPFPASGPATTLVFENEVTMYKMLACGPGLSGSVPEKIELAHQKSLQPEPLFLHSSLYFDFFFPPQFTMATAGDEIQVIVVR